MAINWTNCPRCSVDLKAGTIGELAVKGCSYCRRVCLLGDSKWFDTDQDIEETLKARHELLMRSSPEAMWQEMFDSEFDDPRWNL